MPPNQSLAGMLLLVHDIKFFFFLGGGGVVFKLGFWFGRAVANHACRGLQENSSNICESNRFSACF